jgi:hypothetical protein
MMPFAILKFKLPTEESEFNDARLGVSYRIVLDELDNYLRGRLKYEELSTEINAALQAARDKLWELRKEYEEC